jgi:hypothetical protein
MGKEMIGIERFWPALFKPHMGVTAFACDVLGNRITEQLLVDPTDIVLPVTRAGTASTLYLEVMCIYTEHVVAVVSISNPVKVQPGEELRVKDAVRYR